MTHFNFIMEVLGAQLAEQPSQPEQLAAALMAAKPARLAELASELQDLDLLNEYREAVLEVLIQRINSEPPGQIHSLGDAAKAFGVWNEVVQFVAARNKEVYTEIKAAENVETLQEALERAADEAGFLFQRYRNCAMTHIQEMIKDADLDGLNRLSHLASKWRMWNVIGRDVETRDREIATLQLAYIETQRPHMRKGSETILAMDVRQYRGLLNNGYVEVNKNG